MDEAIGNQISEGLGSAVIEPVVAPVVATPAPVADTTATPLAPAVETPSGVTAQPLAPAATAEPAKPHEAIPLSVALDWRDELKKTKAELAALQKQPAATPPPSFKDDPDGFAAYLHEQTSRVATGTRFEVSEMNAREKFGDTVVSPAMDWGMKRAEESPAFAAEFIKQPNPIAWIVKQHKQNALMTDIGDDPDAYVKRRALELGLVPATASAVTAQPTTTQAATPVTPQPAPQNLTPTRSLAAAPSAGGPATVPQGAFAAFDVAFPSGP